MTPQAMTKEEYLAELQAMPRDAVMFAVFQDIRNTLTAVQTNATFIVEDLNVLANDQPEADLNAIRRDADAVLRASHRLNMILSALRDYENDLDVD